MLVTEKLTILGAKQNRKITSHVLKSIGFQLFSKALGKEAENKTKYVQKTIKNYLKKYFFLHRGKKLIQ